MSGTLRRGPDNLRVGRIGMYALIAGATSYGFGGGPFFVWQASAVSALLATGGLYLINAGEWRKDRVAGKANNPIASGLISPGVGLAVAAVGLLGSLVWGSCLNEEIILALAGVVFLAGGRALGFFATPIVSAVSLSALNGLFVLVGGLAAGGLKSGLVFAVLFLFFAMIGGRVLSDLRDLPLDSMDEAVTIPRKYGIRRSVAFLIVNELAAYVLALAVYWAGAFGPGYLYCALALIAVRTAVNIFLAIKPNPNRARKAVKVSFGALGALYVLGMFLGRR